MTPTDSEMNDTKNDPISDFVAGQMVNMKTAFETRRPDATYTERIAALRLIEVIGLATAQLIASGGTETVDGEGVWHPTRHDNPEGRAAALAAILYSDYPCLR